MGLVPRQYSSVGKELRVGIRNENVCIYEAADSLGARRRAGGRAANRYVGTVAVRAHTPFVAPVALANKNAGDLALLAHDEA